MKRNQHIDLQELTIKELRSIQLDILEDVNDFCKKNSINCFLAYGTLIGAIRHKGYIPWDDDIDIMMTRPDYEKFITNYHSDKYNILNVDLDPRYPYSFSKIHDPSTKVVEYSSLKFDIGVNIDLFTIDGLPNTENKRNTYTRKLMRYIRLKEIKRIKFSKNRKMSKTILLFLLKTGIFFIPSQFVIKRLVKLIKQYDFNKSSFASELNFFQKNRVFRKELFMDSVNVVFENKIYKAPVGYDIWLKTIYGNYMELPPVEERKTHHVFHVYKK